MCKQELWVSQDGATQRFDPEHVSPSTGKFRLLAGVGAVLGIGLIVSLGIVTFLFVRQVSIQPPRPHVATLENPTFAPDNGPAVQSRTSYHEPAARAKPTSQPSESKEVIVVQAVKADSKAPSSVAVSKADRPPAPAPNARRQASLLLESMLMSVPEVDFDRDYMSLSKDKIARKATEISKANKDDKDAFIKNLIKERKDLAGLPFLLGKDCALDSKAAQNLSGTSLAVRRTLAESSLSARPRTQSPGKSMDDDSSAFEAVAAAQFWSIAQKWHNLKDGVAEQMIPAYHQILTGEGPEFRMGLVKNVAETRNARATATLVNRALFDLDPEVRSVALTALGKRPAEEYADALKKALRYPFLPVVHNAVQAIATLDRTEMIPDLIDLLDEPDPRAAFKVKGDDGKEKTMVRELVRINHHRNCMLCHAAVDVKLDPIDRSVPVGPAPTPSDPLPPASTTAYYSVRSGVTVVRADITYLRQDFSLNQAVKDPGKWPAMQRFDFLVRTRELTPAEAAAERPKGHVDVEYRQAINFALRALTSIDAPPSAQEWRKALRPPGKPAAR